MRDDLKIVGKQVWYHNGLKWLVKESCSSNAKAKLKEKELKENVKR